MKKLTRGGGWPAVVYALRTAQRAGGIVKLFRAMRSPNTCKTCALGMGGQAGGMVNESGHFPEVCKKSMQAMAADMQDGISDDFFARYSLDQLAILSPYELEHLGRLTKPLHVEQGGTHYRPIAWDEALARCIDRLKKVAPDQNFFYVSGRSSNEAAFLIQLFARLYGTNNVNNCSYYCHQASGVGLSSALGTGTATITLDDLDQCDLFFLIGGNPASNHPRLMRTLARLRRRGGSVVVINPLRETGLVNFAVPSDARSLLFGSPIASEYVQPHIGGDIALLSGIGKRIDELGATHAGFLDQCTEDAQACLAHLRTLTWDAIECHSGVDRATIDRLARLYAESERTVFSWTMGITHHLHGTDNVRSIVNLALLRGMVGRPGAGLLPIRGHSNVQGIGSVGVTPKLKQAIFDRIEQHYGVTLPTTPGLDSLSCLQAAHAGRLRQGWCLGGNFFGASPDTRLAADALARLDWLCYISTTLNTGHVRGRATETLILPALVRDEEPQPTTQESMFNYVRMSDGGSRRHEGPMSEVALIAHLARGVLGDDGPIDWRSLEVNKNIRSMIGAVVPGYESIAQIDDTRREFQIGGRTFHTPRFNTPTGRAKFHVVEIPSNELPIDKESVSIAQAEACGSASTGIASASARTGAFDARLRLMTIRSEGQFNTVVYEQEDIYRHQDRRDVILMSLDDIERLGLRIDQRVTVRSETGAMRGILVREFDIRAGSTAMYFPEANTLVPTTADPESRTPAYKSVWITLTPGQPRGMVSVGLPDHESAKTRTLHGSPASVDRDALPLGASPSEGRLNAC